MANKVLYREWRPLNFDDVVGQVHVVQALRQAVKSGEVAHAYLFSGTRGTGKTSLAKIFSRAINCLNPTEDGNPCNRCEICQGISSGALLDVIEMDAASNNSVENIRRITDEVLFLPTKAKYKVYIIDEVHMLSNSAFNALLKTLEEPPAHGVFLLATTEPQRIPATILSRCQRYDFKRIPPELMLERLRLIANEHQIAIDDEALNTIVARSEGALRDAISLLDQTRSALSGLITRERVLEMTGIVNDRFMENIITALSQGDTDGLLQQINHMVLEGGDLQRFVASLLTYYRNLLICQTTSQPQTLLQLPERTLSRMKALCRHYSQSGLIEQIRQLSALQQSMKNAQDPRITLEVGLIELLDMSRISDELPPMTGPSAGPLPSAENTVAAQTARCPLSPAAQSTASLSYPAVAPAAAEKTKLSPAKIPAQVPQAPSSATLSFDLTSAIELAEKGDRRLTPNETAEDASALTDVPSVKGSPADRIQAPAKSYDHPEEEIQDKAQPPAFEPSYREIPAFETQNPTPDCDLHPDDANASGESFNDAFAPPPKREQTEVSTAINTDAAKASPVNLDKLWNHYMENLSVRDPLLAILLNPYPHYIEGQELIIEVPAERRANYARMNSGKNRTILEQAFLAIRPEGGLTLRLRLEGQTADEISLETEDSEPAWVSKLRTIAEEMDIPIEREDS